MADLPNEAQSLVENVDRAILKIEEQANDELARIREHAEAQTLEIESKCEQRRQALLQQIVDKLQLLQTNLLRAGDLGKSTAILVQIQALRSRARNILPDPGYLLDFEHVGKTFHFHVTGADDGPVWGTDIYTSDSHLASAAVHAGAVKLGREAVVRVSIVDMSRMSVLGSLRNGVDSMDWGPYNVGYRVARAEVVAQDQ